MSHFSTAPASLLLRPFQHGGMDYIEEARRRRETIVPSLSKVLSEKKNFAAKTKKFWAVVHAVHFLGILGDLRGFGGLVSSGRFADNIGLIGSGRLCPSATRDWERRSFPCSWRTSKRRKLLPKKVVVNEIHGLWNFWDVYPGERERIEGFLLPILKD